MPTDENLSQRGIPVVHGKFQSIMGYFQPDIVPDSVNWFAWLEDSDTQDFAFYELDSDACLCRARKRDGLWYAYQVVGRTRVREVELGTSDKVTIATLWDAYRQLVERSE